MADTLEGLDTNALRHMLAETAERMHKIKRELSRRHKQQMQTAQRTFDLWLKTVVGRDDGEAAPKEAEHGN